MALVRIPTQLRPATGGEAQITADGSTVREVFDTLGEVHPALLTQLLGEDGTLHRFLNVYVDDDDIRYLEGLDSPVGEESTITLLPAVAGGAE
jgi:sulfur-carrier protein